ncbi:hypothetical protein FJZ31_11100 [Candidatus Poribacteria bacterium]|nr:hypothetical protein [Candidatus Poribacteria bacterium]
MQGTSNIIRCSRCQLSNEIPMLYCMRCGSSLLTTATANGTYQITLSFEGGMRKTLAVYRHGQSLRLKQIDIHGPKVSLILEENSEPLEQSTVALFRVLYKGEELWELE